jgi:DNA-binding response OmpR family regulator
MAKTVLVVDDDPTQRRLMQAAAEKQGFRARLAENGEKALEEASDIRNGVDVVLLDLVMPGTSGAEAFAALREIDPKAQVLIVSGYSLDEQVQRLMESGADGFLQKPFSMATLAGRVGPLLRR